jgi:hypothetical protein
MVEVVKRTPNNRFILAFSKGSRINFNDDFTSV